jgi:hypothetical protein
LPQESKKSNALAKPPEQAFGIHRAGAGGRMPTPWILCDDCDAQQALVSGCFDILSKALVSLALFRVNIRDIKEIKRTGQTALPETLQHAMYHIANTMQATRRPLGVLFSCAMRPKLES